MKTLLNWRKTKSCLHDGKLIHYAPEKGTYVYFRINDKEKVMVAFNKNDEEVSLDGSRFAEVTGPAVREPGRGYRKIFIHLQLILLFRQDQY